MIPCALLGVLGAPALHAQQAGIPSPAIARSVPARPDARHIFVLDSAHLLTEAGVRALQDSAIALQRSNGADIAVVTLPTLHGGATDEAARVIGREWKIGSAGAPGDLSRNRGLVILYVPDRTSVSGPNLRIEVGNGLEGAITDGGGARNILEAMKPRLRAKRYDDGFLAGFATAAALIRAEAPRARPRKAPASSSIAAADSTERTMTIVGIVVMVLLLLVFVVGRLTRYVGTHPAPVRDGERRSGTERPSFVEAVAAAFSGPASMDGGPSSESSSSSSDASAGDSSSGGEFGGGGGFSGGGAGDSV